MGYTASFFFRSGISLANFHIGGSISQLGVLFEPASGLWASFSEFGVASRSVVCMRILDTRVGSCL